MQKASIGCLNIVDLTVVLIRAPEVLIDASRIPSYFTNIVCTPVSSKELSHTVFCLLAYFTPNFR